MQVTISIGNAPYANIIKYEQLYLDDHNAMIKHMQDILLKYDNVVIQDASVYLLAVLNSMLLQFKVQSNTDLPDKLRVLPAIDPAHVKIHEINANGDSKCIQDDAGLLHNNYYDDLMLRILDGFYTSLNYYVIDK
jgi:hypothetical protein